MQKNIHKYRLEGAGISGLNNIHSCNTGLLLTGIYEYIYL